ncbi:hypothetical protein Ocin01_20012, partial [Orchesella cincta]
MKFLLLFLAFAGAHSAESVLKCWECQSEHGFHPFECDHINEGRSVDCTSPRAGLEPVCVAWIRTKDKGNGYSDVWLKKFCSWVEDSKIGDATENCGVHPGREEEKTVCWCKSKDNCNQEGILDQGKKGKLEDCGNLRTGAKSASTPPTLLALLTFGIIIIQLGKLRFNLLLLLIGLVTTSGFPAGSEALQCKNGYESDSHSIICNGTNPFCYIRMIDAYQPEEPQIYKGCLEEKEFTPELRHQGLNNHCIVDHTKSNIDVWCYCNDKDDCNKEAINEVGNRGPGR